MISTFYMFEQFHNTILGEMVILHLNLQIKVAFFPSFHASFNSYLLSTVPGTGDTARNQTAMNLDFTQINRLEKYNGISS